LSVSNAEFYTSLNGIDKQRSFCTLHVFTRNLFTLDAWLRTSEVLCILCAKRELNKSDENFPRLMNLCSIVAILCTRNTTNYVWPNTKQTRPLSKLKHVKNISSCWGSFMILHLT